MRLDDEEMALLNEIVRRRRAELIPVVTSIGGARLSTESREELRAVLADELEEHGLGPDHEANAYGLYVDALIGRLHFAWRPRPSQRTPPGAFSPWFRSPREPSVDCPRSRAGYCATEYRTSSNR